MPRIKVKIRMEDNHLHKQTFQNDGEYQAFCDGINLINAHGMDGGWEVKRLERRKQTKGFKDLKRKFIIKYNDVVKHFGVNNDIIRLARKELKYSPRTLDCDIRSSLERIYKEIGG